MLGRIAALAIGWMLCAAVFAQAVAPPPPAAARFSQEQLDRLLAPIALYPDDLLAQVLMASTYPLEVVEAARWARAHPGLSGQALQDALQSQSWDPSVKGLAAVPEVLTMMDARLDWTEMLGDAFLAQQQDVMETVQRLRAKAEAAGNLGSTAQQSVANEGGSIAIEPANPEVVYVPVYDPTLVYGPWWWPEAPYYWYPPGYVPEPGIYFGVGFVVGAAIWGICDWDHRTLVINARNYDRYNRAQIGNMQWAHDPQHRRGAPYPDEATRRRYETVLPGASARREFRGYGQLPSPTPEMPRSAPSRGSQSPSARPPRAATPPAARPAAPAAAPAFESFGRGEAARSYSQRGAASRAIGGGGGRSAAPAGGRSTGGGGHGGAPQRR